jgi:hypothetical protein
LEESEEKKDSKKKNELNFKVKESSERWYKCVCFISYNDSEFILKL